LHERETARQHERDHPRIASLTARRSLESLRRVASADPRCVAGWRFAPMPAAISALNAASTASVVRLLGRCAFQGVPMVEARQRLIDAFEDIAEEKRGNRWRTRRADIDRCVADIYCKEAVNGPRCSYCAGCGVHATSAAPTSKPLAQEPAEPLLLPHRRFAEVDVQR
jgi:hypothetical protein